MNEKEERIYERTHRGYQRRHEPSFHPMLAPHSSHKFIQHAVEHPGRVREAIKREYGDRAFTEKGTIKEMYLDSAIEHAKRMGNVNLEHAEVLAKRLKEEQKK